MTTKTVPDLKELFKQASEIAQQVPESMQEAAFNRALDLLTGAAEQPEAGSGRPSRIRGGKTRSRESHSPEKTDSVAMLLRDIDSTQHPGVASAAKVLDRALLVLQIALRDHNIDGLSPSDIATILTDKFRLNTSDAAVRMALGGATTLVNRVPKGRGFVYRIMGPGEAHLTNLSGEGDELDEETASG